MMAKKINWDDVWFWIAFVTLLVFIGYLVFTGRAWK